MRTRSEPGSPPTCWRVFETGARYQMYHALALVAAAWVVSRWPGPLAVWAGWLFLAGTIVFSGSLYALALTGVRWLGAITPLGGLCFLAGWLCLAIAAARAPLPDEVRGAGEHLEAAR